MNKSIYRRKTEAFPLSTKWLSFYLFVRFPFLFATSFISLITSYAPLLPYVFSSFFPPILYVSLLLDLAFLALHLVTFVKLLKLTPSSYRWNMVLLWYAPGYQAFNMLILGLMGLLGAEFYSSLGSLVGLLVWAILNTFYFKKRKALFDMDVPPIDSVNYSGMQHPYEALPPTGIMYASYPEDPSSANQQNAAPNFQPQPSPPGSPSPNAPAQPEGSPSPQAKFCARCGSPIVPGANFCARCGSRIVSEENTANSGQA